MPIPIPVTRTKIATVPWGIPITNEVNALRAELDALKPTAWEALTLTNGYTNESGFQPCEIRKTGDMVQLRGSATLPASPNGVSMTTIPSNYRPARTIRLAAQYYNGTGQLTRSCRADLNPSNGLLLWYNFEAGALFVILGTLSWAIT